MLNDVIIDLKMIINKQQTQCTEKPRHICQAPLFDSITNHQYFQSLFVVGLYETFLLFMLCASKHLSDMSTNKHLKKNITLKREWSKIA